MIGFLGVIFSFMALVYLKRNRKADLVRPLTKDDRENPNPTGDPTGDKSVEISTININKSVS